MKVHFVSQLDNKRLVNVTAATLELRISDMLAEDNDVNTSKLVPRLKDFFKWAKKEYQL